MCGRLYWIYLKSHRMQPSLLVRHSYRGFLTRMVYLYYISCLRYTILVQNPKYDTHGSNIMRGYAKIYWGRIKIRVQIQQALPSSMSQHSGKSPSKSACYHLSLNIHKGNSKTKYVSHSHTNNTSQKAKQSSHLVSLSAVTETKFRGFLTRIVYL